MGDTKFKTEGGSQTNDIVNLSNWRRIVQKLNKNTQNPFFLRLIFPIFFHALLQR
jgi:hypothetical protein